MKKTIKLKTSFIGLVTCCCLFFSYNSMSQDIYYVIEGAAGNGTSWADASGDIQLLINNASAGDQIWVASGIYKPNRPANDLNDTSNPVNRNNAFVLKAGVEIYGGFTGIETSLEERDWTANPTILTGDFNGNDGMTGSGRTLAITGTTYNENAHHVVIASGEDSDNAVLDGFTITGGNSNGSGNLNVNSININRTYGGGIYIASANITIRNSIIQQNAASSRGSGIYYVGAPTNVINVENSNIQYNLNNAEGGGIYLFSGGGIVNLNNTRVNYNRATTNGAGIQRGANVILNITNASQVNENGGANFGQGIYCTGAGTLNISDSSVSDNQSLTTSATRNGGGIWLSAHNHTVTITNSDINSNYTRTSGGGIYSENTGSIQITGSSISNNQLTNTTGTHQGAGIYHNGSGTLIIDNSIISHNNIGTSARATHGGGIYLGSSSGAFKLLNNSLISQNIIRSLGGGIYSAAGGIIEISDSEISNNTVTNSSDGGGIYFGGSSPVITIENSKINLNTSAGGTSGGIWLQANVNLTIKNSEVNYNSSTSDGGGIYANSSAILTVINSEIIGNHTNGNGGGIATFNNNFNVNIVNSTLSGNTAGLAGDAVFINSNSGTNNRFYLYNSVVWGHTNTFGGTGITGSPSRLTVSHSLVQGSGGSSDWQPGFGNNEGGNIDGDPLFTDVSDGDYTLQETSPAVNVGSNALYTTAGGDLNTDKDLGGNDRLVGVTIDIGAYEFGENIVIPVCTIECPEDIAVTVPASQTTAAVTYDVTFDCDNSDGVTLVLVEGLASGSEFPVGETTVTYQLEFDDTVLANCSFTVTVEQENPVCTIECSEDIAVTIPASQTTAAVTYDVTFDCDNSDGVTLVLTDGLASGSEFPVGETIVTYQLEFDDTVLASCSFTVTVQQEDPVCTIECPEDIVVTVPASQSTAIVTYDVTFDCDNSDGVTLVLTDGLASGSAFPVGETIVTYQLEFDDTVLANCSFTVTVEQENPVCTIECPEDILVSIPEGQAGADVEYEVDFDCDNTDGVTLVLVEGLPSGATFPVGETIVVYNLEFDGEVLDSCTFSVTVEEVLNMDDFSRTGFIIYPNPVTDMFSISGVLEINFISIFDISGKELIRQNVNSQNVNLDISSLSSGIYLLNIVSGNTVQTGKLVKK